jgi:DNA modification methylase
MKPYYEEDGITIYHGDCREILPSLRRFDLLITDPPYGISWSRGTNHKRRGKEHTGIQNDHDTSCRDEVLENIGGLGIVFGSFYAPFPARLKQVLVWQKPSDCGVVGSVTGYRRDAEPIFLVGDWPFRAVKWSSVFRIYRGMSTTARESGHPHSKSVALLESLIRNAGPVSSIIDPFMGTGSTIVAAKNLGRKAIGIEIEERYCEIAAKRLAQGVMEFA